MPAQNDLRLIRNIIAELNANPVARFSYTQDAFDDDIVAGVDVFDANAAQNIPKADKTDYSQTILSKGVRAQGASIPRMGWNHYVGRLSYNLNKLVQKFLAFISGYGAALAHNANEYDAQAAYKNGDMCYTVDSVSGVRVYTWHRRKSLTPDTIAGIPPTVPLHWEEMQSKTSSSALLPFSAPGYRHKYGVADLTGSEYGADTWYPATTDAFPATAGADAAPQVLIEAFCDGADGRAELAVLARFTGFAGSSTGIVLNNAFINPGDGSTRPLADSPVGYSTLPRGRQAVVWLRGGQTYALWNSFGADFRLHAARYDNGADTPVTPSATRPFDITPGFLKARLKSVPASEPDDAVVRGQVDGAISMPKPLGAGAQLNAVRTPGSYVVTDEATANGIGQTPVENPGPFELVVRGDRDGLRLTTQQFTIRESGEEFTRVLSGSAVVTDWYLSGSPNGTNVGVSGLYVFKIIDGNLHLFYRAGDDVVPDFSINEDGELVADFNGGA